MHATLTLVEEIANPDTGEKFLQLQAFTFTAEELANEGIIPESAGDLATASEVEAAIRRNEEAVWSATKVAESDRNDWGGDLLNFDPSTTDPSEQRLFRIKITKG